MTFTGKWNEESPPYIFMYWEYTESGVVLNILNAFVEEDRKNDYAREVLDSRPSWRQSAVYFPDWTKRSQRRFYHLTSLLDFSRWKCPLKIVGDLKSLRSVLPKIIVVLKYLKKWKPRGRTVWTFWLAHSSPLFSPMLSSTRNNVSHRSFPL